MPTHDERALFELLTLEGAQAGLSWLTILKRREGYRRVFDGFDPETVSTFDDVRVDRILGDPSVIRHRQKIASVVTNARAIVALREQGRGFEDLVWSFRATADEAHERSRAMNRSLRAHGFAFVGPTTCHSFMQAGGIVNDHEPSCFRFAELQRLTGLG